MKNVRKSFIEHEDRFSFIYFISNKLIDRSQNKNHFGIKISKMKISCTMVYDNQNFCTFSWIFVVILYYAKLLFIIVESQKQTYSAF